MAERSFACERVRMRVRVRVCVCAFPYSLVQQGRGEERGAEAFLLEDLVALCEEAVQPGDCRLVRVTL